MSTTKLTTFSSSAGQTLTASGTANSYGTKTQIIASTAAASKGLHVQLRASTTSRHVVVQMFTGGSGSEVAFGAPMHLFTSNNSISIPHHILGDIPASTRISAAARDNSGSAQIIVAAQTQNDNSISPFGTVTNAVTLPDAAETVSSIAAVLIDGGGTINTFSDVISGGASTPNNLTASTAAEYNTFYVKVQTAVAANVDFVFRIKSGGTVIFDEMAQRGANGTADARIFGPFFHTLAAGSPLGAEVSCSGNTASSRELRITLYAYNCTLAAGGSPLTGPGGLC